MRAIAHVSQFLRLGCVLYVTALEAYWCTEASAALLLSLAIASQVEVSILHQGKVPIVSAALSKCSQNKQTKSSAQGSLKFREVSNIFWEGTRREKTRLKKVS